MLLVQTAVVGSRCGNLSVNANWKWGEIGGRWGEMFGEMGEVETAVVVVAAAAAEVED
jgi:hypothetical protein